MSNALAVQDPRSEALLRAVGLDKVPAPQRELALAIAERYGLDLMLKHLVLVDGRPMITRDGLLHIAHRSGQFDGIEVSQPTLEAGYWHATASVYRKDMSRPFTYYGRYPAQGGNQKYAPEMATKTAESHAFRRAFDISAPTVDEQWDLDEAATTVERREPVALAAKVAARREAIEARPVTDAAGAIPAPTDAPTQGGTSSVAHAPEVRQDSVDVSGAPDEPVAQPASPGEASPVAGDVAPSPATRCEGFHPQLGKCVRDGGHPANHRNREGETWK